MLVGLARGADFQPLLSSDDDIAVVSVSPLVATRGGGACGG